MRFSRALPVLAVLLAFTGCGYIHFGRLPEATTTVGDAPSATAYSDLRTEHKILQQELALSRKEGDALRAALDNRSDGNAPELTARLQETTRELAALRASYAKLQADRAVPASEASRAEALAKAGALEDKLAATLRDFTQLQEENARLRTDVSRTREENTSLAAQLKTAAVQNEQTQTALSQLNGELLAQKEARARAEQQAEAARAQLSAVVANSSGAKPTLADARETASTSAAVIASPAAKPPDEPRTSLGLGGPTAAPVAELRVNPARVNKPSDPAQAKTPTTAARIHVVKAGDTLETIAKKYYGDAAKWTRIYSINNAKLSGGRPLKPGMELEIPED